MVFDVIDAPQRSPEWRAARAGRLTGSMAARILMKGKAGKESVMRRDYLLQLVAERISGESQENFFTTADMQRGIDLEPRAFAAYEASTGELVERTGFLSCRDAMMGCSLDGHIGNYVGIIELKCPKLATHLSYWEDSSQLIDEYRAQVMHNLLVSGAHWCDLISFDDRVPKRLQLLCVRVPATEAALSEYAGAAAKFLKEVEAYHAMIMRNSEAAA